MAFITNTNAFKDDERFHVFVKNDELLVLDCEFIRSEETIRQKILKCELPANSQSTSPEDLNNESGETSESAPINVLSAAISDKGDSLVACDSMNSIHLWSREQNDWKYTNTGRSARKCQKVIFTHSGSEIILADRGGDVFVFSAIDVTKEGKFILGHISFITDISICFNDKFLASCDRDGKVRVSSYPNCYNIQSYCLGHTQFVSSLNFTPNVPIDILITASGDGCMKLWDIKNGQELDSKHMSEKQSPSGSLSDGCEEISSDDSQLSDIFEKEPSLKYFIRNFKKCKRLKIFAVLYNFLKKVSIYKIRADNKLYFVQDLTFEKLVVDVTFIDNGLLVFLKPSPNIQCFWFEYNECSTTYKSKKFPCVFAEIEDFFTKDTLLDSRLNPFMLFKRQFDDTDEDYCKTKKNKRD